MYAGRKQQGVVLLTLMLIILAAGSYVLLKGLNVAARNSSDDKLTTRAALNEAKRAIINYAIYKPGLNLGPGRLPCPDLTGNGAAAGSCVLGGAFPTTGRFPFATVDSTGLKDSSGAALWYAVADSHRNFLTTPINSDTGDTTDDLSLDGNDSIVAIIIAPGPAIGSQDRTGSPDITDFLESDNATLGDATFTGLGSDPFNDEIVIISRSELMVEVENRVLGDVKNSLNDYFERYGGFPWPSPFSDPTTSEFFESVSATEGHLAIHEAGESFTAPFSLDWNIPVDGSLPTGSAPQDSCVRWNECNDDDSEISYDFASMGGNTVPFPSATCVWTDAEMFNCTGTATVITPVADGELKRTYTVNLNVITVTPVLTAPTSSAGRLRALSLAGSMPVGSSGSIEVSDTLDDVSRGPPRTLTFGYGDTVNISMQNVPFLIGDDSDIVSNQVNSPGALPRWITDNQWHHFIYYAFSLSEAIGGTGCTPGPGGDCLDVQVFSTGVIPDITFDNVKGVAMIAGAALVLPRPGTGIVDYFEGNNNTPSDDAFADAPISSAFNDQVQILEPN